MVVTRYIEKYKNMPPRVKASFWFFVCAFLQKGITVITTPIFTRLMTAAEYGQYNVFNSWLGILTVFVTLKLASGVYLQGMVKYEERRDEYSSSMQGLNLILILFWTVIYLLFSDFWNALFSLTTVQMLAMLVMIWTTEVIAFWAAEQRIKLKYKALVIVTAIGSIAKPAVGVFFVLNAEDKVTARILGIALVELVVYTAFFFVQLRQGKKFFDKVFWKHALMFNIPLIPHYLSTTVLSNSDRIMIESMVNAETAGIYSLAYSISHAMILFNTALLQTINPWLYKKIKDREIEDIKRIAYPSFIGIAVVNIFLIAFAPEVVAAFAPAEYGDAIWVVPPVSMSVFFMFMYTFFASFEFSFEKTKYIAVATVSAAILNIVLNYIFIDVFGYYAAGYTTLLCYMIYAFAHYMFMRRICRDNLDNNQPYSVKVLLGITLSFMTLGFVFLFTYNYTVLRYSLILCLILVLVIKRKTVMSVIKELISVRKKRGS